MRNLSRIGLLFLLAALAFPALAEEDAEPPPADLTEANELVGAGDWAAAEQTLAEILTDHPDDIRVLQMRGEVLVALRRFDEAIPLLERCVELEPERPRIHFQWATALQATDQLDGALAAYGKEIAVNDELQVKVLSHLNRSLLLERREDLAGAADELEAVIELDPTRKRAHGDLATLYLRDGQLEKAAERLALGKAAGFESARLHYNLGAAFFNEGSFEAAAASFREALALDPELADAQRGLGSTLERLDQPAAAKQHFRRYLELKPDARDAADIRERISG